MIIIIVNFNRPNFLRAQMPLIMRNLEPELVHVVNTGQRGNGCAEIAKQYGARYTYMNTGTQDPSQSHALALNVAYAANRQMTDVIGILDHDCFPISPIDINAEIAGKFFFASNQERLGLLYPNPACLFMRTSIGPVDFMPCKGMDTAGQLHNVYSQVRPMAYSQAEHYEMFAGTFLHIVKGSNWVNTESNAQRVAKVFEYVKTFV